MFVRAEIDGVEDPLDHVCAVAGEERRDVDVALLQIFVRIKLVEGALQLPVHGLVTRHLRAHETLFQPVQLIVDLLASRLERSRERWIDRRQLVAQTIKLVIDVVLGIREELRTVSRKMLLDHALDN